MHRLTRMTAFLALVSVSSPVFAQSRHGVLYKDPDCSCCEGHAAYLREHGVALDIKPVADLAAISAEAGVPTALHGCHMILLDGYVIEGHVSIGTIEKLLAERPAGIVGISMPGMPSGVPGMGGEKTGPYEVHAIGKDGSTSVYAIE